MNDSDRPDSTPSEDRLWASLDRFLAGESTEAEADEVRAWLTLDPSHKELLERARRVREIAAARPPSRSLEEFWRRTVAELELDGRAPAEPARHLSVSSRRVDARMPAAPRRVGLVMAASAAASVALFAGGAALWHLQREPASRLPPQDTFTIYATQNAQRLSLRLSDGTRVVLGPGSTLRKPSNYGVAARILYLDGEGYFDVAHDSTRPMAVHTALAVARDLGTRFVVRAYADAAATEVVVAEGKVEVDSVVLRRGQRARVPAGGGVRVTSGVSLDPYFAWTEGRLVFRDTPLREVAVRLARWYDIEVHLANAALGDRRLTASFDEAPVTELFQKIEGPLGLEVRRRGRVYTITGR